jgi:hypothetical protein
MNTLSQFTVIPLWIEGFGWLAETYHQGLVFI